MKREHEAKMCHMKNFEEIEEKFKRFLDAGTYAFEILAKAGEHAGKILEAFEVDAKKKL